jgi:hypothetical protein
VREWTARPASWYTPSHHVHLRLRRSVQPAARHEIKARRDKSKTGLENQKARLEKTKIGPEKSKSRSLLGIENSNYVTYRKIKCGNSQLAL